MGSLVSKPKGPSKSELDAQAAEKRRLIEERKRAENEAEQARRDRLSQQKARSSRSSGRLSLISGSELGASDKLG